MSSTSNCGTGKYRNMKNIATSSAVLCDQCPSGYFQPRKGQGYYNPTICTECPVGYFSGTGWANCGIQCPPGSFQVITTKTCESCPLGKYQGAAGQSTCDICPGGKFSNIYDCEICPSGKFSKPESAGCTDCPTNGWSNPEADHCEECTWCMPGACMPKAENDYCKECTWGLTQATSFMTIVRVQLESDPNYQDTREYNKMYDKNSVMGASCIACCVDKATSCINKPVDVQVIADSGIVTEGTGAVGSKLVQHMTGTGMCSYFLEERKCSTNPQTLKQNCKIEPNPHQLVSAALTTSVSWTLVGLSLLLISTWSDCIFMKL